MNWLHWDRVCSSSGGGDCNDSSCAPRICMCIASLHSIKFTLRKSWHTCMRDRDRARSPEINHDQFYVIFFSLLLTDAFTFNVCRLLLLLLLHFFSMHFASTNCLKKFCSTCRHSDWRHSLQCDDLCGSWRTHFIWLYFDISMMWCCVRSTVRLPALLMCRIVDVAHLSRVFNDRTYCSGRLNIQMRESHFSLAIVAIWSIFGASRDNYSERKKVANVIRNAYFKSLPNNHFSVTLCHKIRLLRPAGRWRQKYIRRGKRRERKKGKVSLHLCFRRQWSCHLSFFFFSSISLVFKASSSSSIWFISKRGRQFGRNLMTMSRTLLIFHIQFSFIREQASLVRLIEW